MALTTHLKSLGQSLRARREAYGKITGQRETLSRAAERLGIDAKTLRQMEAGSLSVTLGKYYHAAQVYGGLEGFERLFAEDKSAASSSLFTEWPKS
jgi:transcriptional regulator with XRE-family HTH domain